jgi:hypothetical protein
VLFTIIAVTKTEPSYLPHWLYYHYRLGFDQIFVASSDCDDRAFNLTREAVVGAPVPNGFVQLIDMQSARCAAPLNQIGSITKRCYIRRKSGWLQPVCSSPLAAARLLERRLWTWTSSSQLGMVTSRFRVPWLPLTQGEGAWALPEWTLHWKTFGSGGQILRPKFGTVLSAFITTTKRLAQPRLPMPPHI